jgi:hypothetical protein
VKTILKKKFFATVTIAVMAASLMLMVIPQASATWTYLCTYDAYDRGWEYEYDAGEAWANATYSWAYAQVIEAQGWAAGGLNSEEYWYSGDTLTNIMVKVELDMNDLSWDPPSGTGWVGLEMKLYVRGSPVGTSSRAWPTLSTTMNTFYFLHVTLEDGDWLDFDITARVETGGTTQTVNIAADYGDADLYVDI